MLGLGAPPHSFQEGPQPQYSPQYYFPQRAPETDLQLQGLSHQAPPHPRAHPNGMAQELFMPSHRIGVAPLPPQASQAQMSREASEVTEVDTSILPRKAFRFHPAAQSRVLHPHRGWRLYAVEFAPPASFMDRLIKNNLRIHIEISVPKPAEEMTVEDRLRGPTFYPVFGTPKKTKDPKGMETPQVHKDSTYVFPPLEPLPEYVHPHKPEDSNRVPTRVSQARAPKVPASLFMDALVQDPSPATIVPRDKKVLLVVPSEYPPSNYNDPFYDPWASVTEIFSEDRTWKKYPYDIDLQKNFNGNASHLAAAETRVTKRTAGDPRSWWYS